MKKWSLAKKKQICKGAGHEAVFKTEAGELRRLEVYVDTGFIPTAYDFAIQKDTV